MSRSEPKSLFVMKAMLARAVHINGNLEVESAREHGMKVALIWKAVE